MPARSGRKRREQLPDVLRVELVCAGREPTRSVNRTVSVRRSSFVSAPRPPERGRRTRHRSANSFGILLAAGRAGDHGRTVDLPVRPGVARNTRSALGSVHGAAGALPARDPRLVRAELRRADAGAGAGLAGDRGGRPCPDPGADRLGEDARGVPLRHRPADGDAWPRPARPLRLAAEGAQLRRRAEPARPARGPPVGTCASPSAPATRRRRSAPRCCASRRTS